MLGRRLVSTITIVLWLVFLFFLSIPIREQIAHTYHHLLPSPEHLHVITKDYSLAILGSGDYLNPDHGFLFYIFWGGIWLVPLAMLFFTWRIKEPSDLLEFLFYSWLSYLFVTSFLFLLAIFGLILPFLYL
jgi:hypothetical protein